MKLRNLFAIAALASLMALTTACDDKNTASGKPDPKKPEVVEQVLTVKDGVLLVFPELELKEGVATLGDDVTEIAEGVFAYNKKVTKVVAPKVTKVKDAAFSGATALASVEMPLVEEVGDNAFAKTALKEVALPEVKEIGSHAFSSCASLTAISLPKVEKVDNAAFSGATALASVEMPLVEEVGDNAFAKTALTEVSLPEVKEIGSHAFSSCTALTSISLPKVEKVKNAAFAGCEKLTSAEFGPKIPEMGDENPFVGTPAEKNFVVKGDATYNKYDYQEWAVKYGFKNFNGEEIKAVAPPEGLEAEGRKLTKMLNPNKGFQYRTEILEYFNEIGDRVFANKSRGGYDMAHFTANGVKKIGERSFQWNVNLRTVNMPMLVEIGKEAFFNCKYMLAKLDNIQSVEILGEDAFRFCTNIELCVFPNLKKIGNNAFRGCTKMRNSGIIVLGATPPELEGELGESHIHTLIAPSSAKEAYEKWEHIGKFTRKIFDDAEYKKYVK